MSSSLSESSSLRRALLRYVDARQASIIGARRDLGINELDARAILFIATRTGTRPTALREYLGITSAGVTTLIDRLVHRGAVRRDVDPTDRRVNRLSVTVDLSTPPWSALTRFDDAFEAALVKTAPAHADRFARVLDELTDVAASGRD